jgi:hypothetical protein
MTPLTYSARVSNEPLGIPNAEQDKQCTYNVTMRRLHENSVAVGKQKVLHILSVCMCVCVCGGGRGGEGRGCTGVALIIQHYTL